MSRQTPTETAGTPQLQAAPLAAVETSDALHNEVASSGNATGSGEGVAAIEIFEQRNDGQTADALHEEVTNATNATGSGTDNASGGATVDPLADLEAQSPLHEDVTSSQMFRAAEPLSADDVGPRRLSSGAQRRLLRKNRLAGLATREQGTAVARSRFGVAERKLVRQIERKDRAGSNVTRDSRANVQQLQVTIGGDDRVRIRPTTPVPWRRLCALRITFPSGRAYRGTGFLIGPRAVATAGHCVYLHSEGGWAREVEVIPAMDGPIRPFGSIKSPDLRAASGWIRSREPESDYGCVILPSGAFGGRNLGGFTFAALDEAAMAVQPTMLAGYPGDKPFAELWGASRRILSVQPANLVFAADTIGLSGSPVYIKRDGDRVVVGILNNAGGGKAVRVTTPVYARLKAWSEIV